MIRHKILIGTGFIGALVGLTACGNETTPPPIETTAGKSMVAPSTATPLPVTLRPANTLFITNEREAVATAISRNEAKLSAEISAIVTAIPKDIGEQVAHDEVVVKLNSRDAELALAQAEATVAQVEARLSQAKTQLERARRLREDNFVTIDTLTQRETEVTVIEADLKAAKAGVETARHNVEKCELRAPFPAIIKTRNGQVGELAVPGMPLLTLVDRSRIEVAATVQLKDAENLRKATEIFFDGAGGKKKLRLVRVSSVVNRETRSIEARLAFVEAAALTGEEGRIVWLDQRPVLAPEFLVKRGDDYGVFIAENNKARFVPLPDAREGRQIAADSLPDNALLITKGRHAVQDGQAIQTTQAAPTPDADKPAGDSTR